MVLSYDSEFYLYEKLDADVRRKLPYLTLNV